MKKKLSKTHHIFVEKAEEIRPQLMGYCRHMVWDRNGFEDILQEVLTTVYQKYSSFQEGSSFSAWVFQIATFVILNHNRCYQKERGHFQGMDDEKMDISQDMAAEMEEEILYDSLLQNPKIVLEELEGPFKKALLRLNENERAVFLLRTLGDLSYQEIAKVLEMPIGSVMGFLPRARAKLRKSLCEYARSRGYEMP